MLLRKNDWDLDAIFVDKDGVTAANTAAGKRAFGENPTRQFGVRTQVAHSLSSTPLPQ